MEHIKTPVKADARWGAQVLFDADGRECARVLVEQGNSRAVGIELAAALNVHDALAEACEALYKLIDRMDCEDFDWEQYREQKNEAVSVARTALKEAQ